MIKVVLILVLVSINNLLFASEYTYENDYRIRYSENYLENIPVKNNDGSFNAVIEIPSGTNQKWIIDQETNSLELEFQNSLPTIIKYLPFPTNFGILVNTNSLSNGNKDGNPINILVLNENPIERGDVVKVKIIGMLRLENNGKIENQIISVKVGSIFEKIKSLKELEKEYIGILEIFSIWFKNYKNVNNKILGYDERKKTINFIEEHISFKNE